MKNLLLALILVFSCETSFAGGSLAEVFYPGESEVEAKTVIEAITKKELANTKSPLSKLIASLEKENDCPDSCGISISAEDASMVYTGKSGVQYFGFSEIVPVWMHNKGTGLISQVIGYLVVSFSTNMEKGTTVKFEKYMKFKI